MKEKLYRILRAFHEQQQSPTMNFAQDQFCLDLSVEYDALVVAPGWIPR